MTMNGGISRPTLYVDIHEPTEIDLFLRKSLDVVRMNCEPSGLADYWLYSGFDPAQHIIAMWERKKGNELLMTMGRKLDTQLIKYRTAWPTASIGIIQEGVILPLPNGMCQAYRLINGKKGIKILTPQRKSGIRYSAYRAYLNARASEGIQHIVTSGLEDTAITLQALAYNVVKSTHTGLNHYDSSPVPVEVLEKFPLVKQLMSIPGIGVTTAANLLTTHGTPWNIYNHGYDMLSALENKRLAKAIFNGIGKKKPGDA